ncbi:MAG TPA: hypothetical protein VHF89_19740 [Solirubrobacteraceae bacterium]|nr:hypothetical protein [Solirubrobacteraceae bacterium]
MKLRTTLILTTAALVVAAVAPATASAVKNFEGNTQQNRTITMSVGDDNLLDRLRINWITRRCALSGSRFQHITAFRRPYDESNIDAFRDVGSFTVADRGRIRSRVRVVLIGQRTFDPANPAAEEWNGTFQASVVVRRRGRVIDRCRLRQIAWNATLVPAG